MENKERRKSFFVNEDGTLIIPSITFVVVCITSIIVFLGFKDAIVAAPRRQTTTKVSSDNNKTTTTAEFKEECKNCILSFKRQYVEVEANSVIDLEDILTADNISPYYVKYKNFDEKLISIDSGKLEVKVLNALGETNLTAYYQNLTTSIKIIVSQKYVSDADFDHQVNYVYQGAASDLDVTLYPTGIERKYLKMVSLDPDILDFDANGQALGKQIGKATVRFEIDGVKTNEQKTATVYVVRNKIQIFYRTEEGFYMDEDSTKYTSKLNGTIYLAIKYEDNDKKGYSVEDGDLTWESQSFGCLSVRDEITSEGINPADPSMHVFKVPVKYDADKIDKNGYNGIEILFKLPDGSIGQFNINRT